MAISKSIWRFQCDPNGEADPTVHVFLREETTVDGKTFVNNSTSAVPMKFSELAGLSDLVSVSKIEEKQAAMEVVQDEGVK
jgi:hypothetical protein